MIIHPIILGDIQGLDPDDGNFIVGDGSNWVAESGNTARTSLGLGTGNSPNFDNVGLYDSVNEHYLVLAAVGGSAGVASNKFLNINLDGSHRTLTFSGNPTLDNWFDQSVKQAASPTFASGVTVGTLTFADGSITDSGGTINFGDEDITTSGRIISTGGGQTGKFLTGSAGNTVFAFSGGNFDIRAGDGTQSVQNVLRVTSAGDFDFKAGNLTTTGSGTFADLIVAAANPGIWIQNDVLNQANSGHLDFTENAYAFGATPGYSYGFRIKLDGLANKLIIQSGSGTTVADRLSIARDTGNVDVVTNFTAGTIQADNGFTGSWVNNEGDTVTVVGGVITNVAA